MTAFHQPFAALLAGVFVFTLWVPTLAPVAAAPFAFTGAAEPAGTA